MPTLYLIRGVSGSGKTTLAQKMATEKGCRFLEADMYFVCEGEYLFDARRLPVAHEWCKNEAIDEMRDGHDVIVSNTFTRLWEMRNYIDFANLHGYKIHIITCTGMYQNVHGLTEAMVAKQVARFQSNQDIAEELAYDAQRFGKIVYSYH
jgi:predicted kinase